MSSTLNKLITIIIIIIINNNNYNNKIDVLIPTFEKKIIFLKKTVKIVI